jgi:DNA-binding transcriptional ArsR family regulator
VLRVHCTPQDLLRVSIAEHPAPLAELGLAFGMAQRRDADPLFTPWRRQLLRSLPREARPLLQLLSPLGAGPLFLDPESRDVDEGLDQVLGTPRSEVRAELRRVCGIDRPVTPWIRGLADRDAEAWRILERALRTAYASVLAADWPRIKAGFHAERAWRSQLLANHGLFSTLTGLSPAVRWRGLTLEADFPRQLEIRLHGQGIVLRPSSVWTGHPLVGQRADGRLLLIYPALTPLPLLDAPSATAPLSALLGPTRARALQLLTDHHTTTSLARNLSITPAAASLQTKTLREAGLITTHRDGKSVYHACTPLGLDLLSAP